LPSNRYEGRERYINADSKYKDILAKRGISFVEQYRTGRLRYPTSEQMRGMRIDRYIWKVGDKYWKLAQQKYGDPELWWILAWFNKKPTEAHMNNGDLLFVPYPLEKIYTILAI